MNTSLLKHKESMKQIETNHKTNKHVDWSIGSFHSANNRIGITVNSLIELLRDIQDKHEKETNLCIGYFPVAEKTYYKQLYTEDFVKPTPFLDTIATYIDTEGTKRPDSYALLDFVLDIITKSIHSEVLYEYNNFNHAGLIPNGSSMKIVNYNSKHVMYDFRIMGQNKSLNLIVTSDLRQCVRAVSHYSTLLPRFDPVKLNLDTVFLYKKWKWYNENDIQLFCMEDDVPHFIEISPVYKNESEPPVTV